jgi:hypothetical protein
MSPGRRLAEADVDDNDRMLLFVIVIICYEF